MYINVRYPLDAPRSRVMKYPIMLKEIHKKVEIAALLYTVILLPAIVDSCTRWRK